MIWCGLSATWHSYGNRVSKTRFPCVNDVAIRCQRIQVEAPGNRVLKTRFPIGLFQILKPVSTVSLSLSLTPTPTPTPSHSQTRAPSLSDETDPLSPCQPHPRHRRSSSHSLSLTHAIARPSTLSASPTPWSPSVCTLKSFSLWKPKKKRWVLCVSFFFFFFGFCFEFPIELLKKIETLLFFEFGSCF